MATRVVIADDHDILREGIKSILRDLPEYSVVGEAADGEALLECIKRLRPDIVLLDITMPERSGLDALAQVAQLSPHTKVIMVTMHRSATYWEKAMAAGVCGYLSKENLVQDLKPALECVRRGGHYSSSVFPAAQPSGPRAGCGQNRASLPLTEREKDVLRLVAGGKTAKEIAEILFLSRRTVENYKNNLLKKLDLHRTGDLIKYAIQNNFVDWDG